MAEADDLLLNILRATLVNNAHLSANDLSLPHLAVLLMVYLADKPMNPGRLARHLDVYGPIITQSLDRLSQDGLIERIEDPWDRRRIIAQRTLNGRALMQRLTAVATAAANAEQRASRIISP